MTTISLRLNDEDGTLFRTYAEMHGITMTELIRKSVIEHIEDTYDLELYKKALAEHKANPVVHSMHDVARELGLD